MKTAITAVAAAALLSGCATIVKDKSDTVSILTPDCPAGTKCQVSNKKGSWEILTPHTISVPKSDDPLVVSCSTPDGREMKGELKSTEGGMIWGNLLFGGIIGVVWDAHTDASREYGDMIALPLCAGDAASEADAPSSEGQGKGDE